MDLVGRGTRFAPERVVFFKAIQYPIATIGRAGARERRREDGPVLSEW